MTTFDGLDVGEWAGQFGWAEFGTGPGDLVCVGDFEVAYYISERHGVFVLEFVSRGGPRRGSGSFPDAVGAARLLVLEIGVAQRSTRRLPPLRGIAAPSVELETGPTAIHLTWSTGWAELPLPRVDGRTARLYSQAVGHPLPIVAESILHPTGFPLFGRPS